MNTLTRASRLIIFSFGLLALSLTGAYAAELCPSYHDVTDKLQQRFKEQKLFNGFANDGSDGATNALYELWGNSERGNWSLVAHKVVQFDDGSRRVTRTCAFVVDSGHRFQRRADAPFSYEQTGLAGAQNRPASCLTRDHHAQLLAQKYHEQPLFSALSKDASLLEVYAGDNSWTMTRARLQPDRGANGGAVRYDQKTGQEIHRLCSSALYSGVAWGIEERSRQLSGI